MPERTTAELVATTEQCPGSWLHSTSNTCRTCGGRFRRDTTGRLLPHLRKRRDDG